MAKIAEVVKLKSGYANFVELKSAFEAAQENAGSSSLLTSLTEAAPTPLVEYNNQDDY